jgi:cytochrome oxidase assembly protein ShyY1
MNRRQAQKDWFAIARTPTWLARLLMALALAAVFALLGQWQLGRALPAANPTASPNPNATAGAGVAGQSVFKVKVDQANIAIIGGRLQPGGKNGFWLVSNSKVLRSANQSDVGKELTIAWGWAPTFEAAVAAHVKFQTAEPGQGAHRVAGVLAAAEAPLPEHPTQPFLFDSLSLGQLVNFYQPFQARNTLEKYLIAQPSAGKGASKNPGVFAGLEPIVLTPAPAAPLENVNWLSAFYAIEWSVFAGFAVFMWWRLVEDERLRRKADAEAES